MMLILLLLTLLLYCASAGVMWRQLATAKAPNTLTWGVAVAAVLSHGILLWSYLASDDFDHLNVASSLSAVAFLLALFALFRAHRNSGLVLRPVIYLFAAVSCIILWLSPASWGANIAESHGLVIHIVLSLLAYAILMLATLYAVQLLYLTYLLKNHRMNALSGYLPPLMVVESYFFRLLSTGTLLLFIAIGSGFVFLNDMFAQGQSHKTVLSLIAAAIYLTVVILHGVQQVRGRSLVVASVVASIILSLGYFGSRFVRDVLLN
ncbi:cytochrome c biogenesis protein CcsA [Pseudidiomarina sp. 1APR75-15]|uniref:Cytochrome c biogenesis protein CcsA n=2 Tax=Pseudidiomarina terrestris TaxID=2820060 RepID=A0ABT8MKA6_9GAMM|nr:cytochrome c biogenesis protein CcsA [Pseudidiomarina sp. 1APR75-33.1]MDN7130379.1 cytochrome c biogenesis protein CcsA [Pseudidiomarina sp. 1APR75-15]MDN7136302.1 cytochrome c biogenesis protein CcsA [Pseudidiomarina sp. 1ASP75-5]MDN7138781.1 cytochrome c biogenesis protein CcsA [Pseudidiomarina sp. 1ASP75-14]MEA3588756.1 cytochrome c biogenesis protein CcsA [Pseudidiomarina sp. 1APP75-27a]